MTQPADDRRDILAALNYALAREQHVLRMHPEFAWQQLHNRLQWEPDPVAGILAEARARRTGPWLRTRWRFGDGAMIFELAGHAGAVASCRVSPDGSRLVSAGKDGTLRIWDLERGIEVATFGDSSGAFAITDDGERVIWVDSRGAIRASAIREGHHVAELPALGGPVSAMAVRGDRAVTAHADGLLRVWHLPEGQEEFLLGAGQGIVALLLDPAGSRLASATRATLTIWDLDRRAEIASLSTRHGDWFRSLATSPDGRILAANHGLGVAMCDFPSGRALAIPGGHPIAVTGAAVTPDARTVVSGAADGTIRLWDPASGTEIARLTGHVATKRIRCAVTPDGRYLVSASQDRTVKVWDLQARRHLATLTGHTGSVEGCAVTPDGTRIVSWSTDRTIKVWSIERALEIAALDDHRPPAAGILMDDSYRVSYSDPALGRKDWDLGWDEMVSTSLGHAPPVEACAMTADGRHVVSARKDGVFAVRTLEDGAEIRSFKGHSNFVTSCAAGPDSTTLVSGGWDSVLKVWDITTGAEVATLKGHRGWIHGCAVDPKGEVAVSAAEDKTLKVWPLPTRREKGRIRALATLRAHRWSVDACAITPDGALLVSGGGDTMLLIWELPRRRRRRRIKPAGSLNGHSGRVLSCAITPDGSRIVSASRDGTLKIWDLARRAEVGSFAGHVKGVAACAITSDGSAVFSAGEDGLLKAWDLDRGVAVAGMPFAAQLRCVATHPSLRVAVCGDGHGNVMAVELVNGPA